MDRSRHYFTNTGTAVLMSPLERAVGVETGQSALLEEAVAGLLSPPEPQSP